MGKEAGEAIFWRSLTDALSDVDLHEKRFLFFDCPWWSLLGGCSR